jgi:hypothetical protein
MLDFAIKMNVLLFKKFETTGIKFDGKERI